MNSKLNVTHDRALGLAKKMRYKQMADYFSSRAHFSSDEVACLLNIFRQFTCTNNNRLDRLRFRTLFHACFNLTDDIMLDLLFHAYDRNNDGVCDEEEFVNGLSVLLRGTLAQQTDLCYRIYDMNGDGSLAREELYQCLRGCILPGYGIPDEEIEDAEKDIIEIVMRKLDYDQDGQITFSDFKEAVKRDPLLLTSIGECMPNASGMSGLLSIITEDYHSYSPIWYKRPLLLPLRRDQRQSIAARLAHHGQHQKQKRARKQDLMRRPSFLPPILIPSVTAIPSQMGLTMTIHERLSRGSLPIVGPSQSFVFSTTVVHRPQNEQQNKKKQKKLKRKPKPPALPPPPAPPLPPPEKTRAPPRVSLLMPAAGAAAAAARTSAVRFSQ